jgi:hypothetical protein
MRPAEHRGESDRLAEGALADVLAVQKGGEELQHHDTRQGH